MLRVLSERGCKSIYHYQVGHLNNTYWPYSPLDLHAPPPGLGHPPGRNRFIFRQWPRASDGQFIKEAPYELGKKTSNGWSVWGETLYDFYHTARIPSNIHLVTKACGSRLAAIMRGFGELDAAADEISWANTEADPEQIYPCDIAELIKEREGLDNKRSDGSDRERLLRDVDDIPKLEQRLPFHLLPETLVIHDSGDTLFVDSDNHYRHHYGRETYGETDAEQTAPEEKVYSYQLKLSSQGRAKVEEERKQAEEEDKKRIEKDMETWHILPPEIGDSGPSPPYAIHYKLPPRPRRPTSVKEAHLYIQESDRCGTGNHSMVYNATLELPRRVLVNDMLCQMCLAKAIDEEIAKLKAAGNLFEHGSSEGVPLITPVPRKLEGRRELFHVEPGPECCGAHHPKSNTCKTNIDLLGPQVACIESAPRVIIEQEYSGPFVRIVPKVKWQSSETGPMCAHMQYNAKTGPTMPPTVRVRVCGKLSLQNDTHLGVEARNYQKFPASFFEHWTGYNLIYPLHDPTPVGALVPQFYGYYAPPPQAPGEKYMSPILLLEICGKPVSLGDLTEDERNECAAKYFMFTMGGWAQNSMYERNVLVQKGPITAWPAKRSREKRSFRLIDFGRAEELAEGRWEFVTMKEEICKLFKIGHYGF